MIQYVWTSKRVTEEGVGGGGGTRSKAMVVNQHSPEIQWEIERIGSKYRYQ